MTPSEHNSAYLTPARMMKAIIAVNIIMFIISLILTGDKLIMTAQPFQALSPSMDTLNFLGASGRHPITQFEAWWSLITANWLHGSLLHILFNMLALNTVGPLIIREFGKSRMFCIYTLTGITGFLLSYIGNVYMTIGASSGLCGLIGAALYFGKSRGGQWGQLVYKQTTGWVVSLILIGFFIPNINNWSHAGGLVSGIVFGWLFGYNEQRKENLFDKGFALFWAVLTIWLLGRSALSGIYLKFFS
jgi:rhomboid protease GluP